MTFVLSLTKEPVEPSIKHRLTAEEQAVQRGKQLLKDKNCVGCHEVYGEGEHTIVFVPTWALIHFLRAAEIDFADVLEKKNARVSLQQIIRELEATQETVWSPMVLNGSGFGFVANHSLVMASYISRANAAIIDLRRLLSDG